MDIEQRLRTDLADRASDIDAAPDLIGPVVEGYRRQNRRRAGLLAAGVCAAVAAVAIPLGTGAGPGGDGGEGGPGRSAGLVDHEPYPIGPRGDLADDAAYVDGLLERDWYPSPELPEPAPETRQVLFAGEVPGGVLALVTGWEDGARTGLWLHGRVDAAPTELEALNEPSRVPENEPVSFSYTEDGVGALVVLARPGDTIEVSPGRDIAADGTVVQAPFEVVGEADGVAVVDAARLTGMGYVIRVTRDDEQVYEGTAQSGASTGGPGELDAGGTLEGSAGDPDPVLVRLLVDGLLRELGLTTDEVEVDALWGGPIGNRNRPDVTAALLAVRVPSGATVLLGGFLDPLPEGSVSGSCMKELLPAGTEVTGAAMRCDLFDSNGGAALGSQLVVVPPAGTVQLRLVGSSGAVIDSQPLEGSAWIGPAPDGVRSVTALDAGGEVLAEIPLGTTQDLLD